MLQKRLMGIDYGDSRIGLALSDPLQIIASAYETFQNKGQEQALEHICEVIKSQNVGEIAFGLPLNMDGSEGERALKHRQFGAELERRSGVKVVFVDERLTSAEAEDILREAKVKWQDRKKVLDKLSAQIILQTHMNSK